ncbi:MAG: AzlC family ABC transporter permease [Pseudomonadota bacterium]
MTITTSSSSAFLRGVRGSAPFLLPLGPFAFLFGVVGTEAGLNIAQVMGFSVLVIAGASQLTALQLMADQAPTFIVLISALAVNLRMAMYSASLAPWMGGAPFWQRGLAAYLLVDNSYAQSLAEYERQPQMTVAERMSYFFGAMLMIAPGWYAGTILGALVGREIPDALALDFAVPITFLAIVVPALRTLAHVAAAMVAVIGGLALAWLPYSLGLLPAGLLAMMVGAEVERWGWARPLRREAGA